MKRPSAGTPVRTCIGCRERSTKSGLLRLVVHGDTTPAVVSPDPRGTAPGRGAYLHPTLVCLDQAERRRAFPRALRVKGTLDAGPVRAYVQAVNADRRSPGDTAASGDAAKQEEAEHQLMNQR